MLYQEKSGNPVQNAQEKARGANIIILDIFSQKKTKNVQQFMFIFWGTTTAIAWNL
jgi:hypothetical protein